MLTQKFGDQLCNVLVFILIARLLDARDFGLMAMAYVAIQFLSIFSSQGLTSSVIQRKEINEGYLNTAFCLNMTAALIITAISLLLAKPISLFYGEHQLQPLLMVLSLNIILESLTGIQSSILQRDLEYKSLALRNLIGEVLSGVLGVAMALYGFGIWSLVARSVSRLAIQVAVFWFLSPWRPKLRLNLAESKDILGYGSNVLGVNLLNFGARQLDQVLIGYFMGAKTLGEYSIAKRIVGIAVGVVRNGAGNVSWSLFSRLQDNLASLNKALFQVNQLVVMGCLPIFAALYLFAYEYIPLFFGEKWIVSSPIAQAIAIAGFMESIRSIPESAMLASGKASLRLKLAAVIATANIITFFILYKEGIYYLSIGYAVVAVVTYPLWLAATKSITRAPIIALIPSYKEGLVATTLVILLHFYITAQLGNMKPGNELIFLALEFAILLPCYFIAVYVLNRKLVSQLISNFKKR